MNKKSIIVFCPNPSSLYTVSVCELLLNRGYSIDHIIVRKFTFKRFRTEFSRDGKRLLIKIWKKLFLKEAAYPKGTDSLPLFRSNNKLKIRNVREFKKNGTKILYCNTLNDQIVEDTLKMYDDKLVVFTGGGIIRKNILDVAGDGVINCHMGILPRYKGMDLPEWCILENKTEELGITLHFMDTGIDTGYILRKVKIPLKGYTCIKSLRNSFEPIMVKSMVDVVDDYLNGRIKPLKQESENRRQYFIVHKKLYDLVDSKLKKRTTIANKKSKIQFI